MLIAKGFAVTFIMDDGRRIKAPAGYALLHDQDGTDFPRCSGFVMPFQHSARDPEVDNATARTYFGHQPFRGSAAAPPRALSAWRRVGDLDDMEVDEILYTRRRPRSLPVTHGARYFHPFKGRATLYRHGRLFRIELGAGCVWNARGVVTP